jgi:hypothetical protein
MALILENSVRRIVDLFVVTLALKLKIVSLTRSASAYPSTAY